MRWDGMNDSELNTTDHSNKTGPPNSHMTTHLSLLLSCKCPFPIQEIFTGSEYLSVNIIVIVFEDFRRMNRKR